MRRMENFLVYVDDVNATLGVLDRIVEWTQAGQARLTFAGVVEPIRSWITGASGLAAEVENELARKLESQLNELAQTLTNSDLDVHVRVYHGDPTRALVQAVFREGYDVLFKASEQERGQSGHALSSIERQLLRVCPCPVAILRPLQPDYTGGVLAPVNFDPEQQDKGDVNDVILEVAVRAALAGFRELHILHIWSLFGESSLAHGFARESEEGLNELRSAEEKLHREWLDTLVEEFLGKMGPEIANYLVPKVHLLKGNPRQIVPQQVELLRPDLLVIGSVARTGVSGLLMGNTAEAILNKVDCSVATVKPPGFKLPIHL